MMAKEVGEVKAVGAEQGVEGDQREPRCRSAPPRGADRPRGVATRPGSRPYPDLQAAQVLSLLPRRRSWPARCSRIARSRRARDSPELNADGAGCTTRLSKTHGTNRRVLYEFHPWAGQDVVITRMVARFGVPVAHCRLVGCESGLPLEVPLWMFDQLACSQVRHVERPQVDLTALQALRGLLDKAADGDGRDLVSLTTASDDPADLKPCDRKPGADHAPTLAKARPATPVLSSSRLRPARDAVMAEPAVPDAPAGERLADAAVSGPPPSPGRPDNSGRGPR